MRYLLREIDNDGDLDVATFNLYNYLYLNNSDTFTDITVSTRLNLSNPLSLTASFFDYDNSRIKFDILTHLKSNTKCIYSSE